MSDRRGLPPGHRYTDARLHHEALIQGDRLRLDTGASLGDHIYKGPRLLTEPIEHSIYSIYYIQWDTDTAICTILTKSGEKLAELRFTSEGS